MKTKPHSMIAKKLDSMDAKLDEIQEEVSKWLVHQSKERR